MLSRLKNGDVAAFDIVFKEYYSRLCSFAAEHGVDGDVASDIVQDVMLSLWEKREKWNISTQGALTGYLFQSVRNLVKRYHRDTIAHQAATESDTPAMSVPADQRTELHELQDDLRAVIDAMPPDRRVAVSLKLYEDMSYDEIAEIMGVGPPAVRMHLSRARTALALVFERHKQG